MRQPGSDSHFWPVLPLTTESNIAALKTQIRQNVAGGLNGGCGFGV